MDNTFISVYSQYVFSTSFVIRSHIKIQLYYIFEHYLQNTFSQFCFLNKLKFLTNNIGNMTQHSK